MLDLLDLAQIENRSLKINCEYFNLDKVIDQAFMIVGHVQSIKSLKLLKIIDPAELVHFRNLYGDERRYLQILINFISNAIKFSPKGSKIIVELCMKQVK